MPRPKKTSQHTAISDDDLQIIAGRFKLLADGMRLRILHTLQDGERTVSQIVAVAGTTQANISKHLAILSRGQMITRRKEGTNAFYSIADPVIFELCELMCNHAPESR